MKKEKNLKTKKLSINKYKSSKVKLFRDEWLKKGYDLVNITTLCEAKIGNSGYINDFNEPDEACHHIQIKYRYEPIANFDGTNFYVIDDERYIIYIEKCRTCKIPDDDFIIFRKVKL